MKPIRTRLLEGTGSELPQNFGWSVIGETTRLVTQVVVFLVLTRMFDPDQYGVLVGTLALLMFLEPYTSLGSTHLLMLRVAGDSQEVHSAAGAALGTALAGGVVSIGLLLPLQALVVPQAPMGAFVALAVSQLLAVVMVEVTVFVGIATEQLRSTATVRGLHGLFRIVAAVVLLALTDSPSIWQWGLLTALAAFFAALAGQVLMLGAPVRPLLPTRADVTDGLPLSVGIGAQSIISTADSFLLVRLDRETDAGLHGAASRIVNIARIPLQSLLLATNARIHAAGGRSIRQARDLAARLSAAALGLGSIVALVIYLSADLVVNLLPDEYAEVATALRWMAVMPLFMAVAAFGATALTAGRFHTHRIVIVLGSGAINVILNLAWIPDHGWRGAVIASLISLAVFASAVWLTLTYLVTRESQGAAPPSGQAKNR